MVFTVQLEAAGFMGSVSHERFGAAQETGKRCLTPMMWSPLMSVRRSWFSIGSAPACASKNHDVFLVASPPTPSTRRRLIRLDDNGIFHTGAYARCLVRHI